MTVAEFILPDSTICSNVGIEDNSHTPIMISIFPNPATEQITITGYYSLPAQFTLYDITGKMVMKKKLNSHYESLVLHVIPSGLYIYEFDDGNTAQRGKIVVEK